MRKVHCRGYALVSVLWLIVLLTGIAAAYHAQARVEARLLATALQRAQAEEVAEAGVWLAVHEHIATTAIADRAARVTRTLDVYDIPVEITIADTSGLINLNGAPPELLAALLAARSGLEAAEQTAVVDAILDWRDSDDTRRPAGAEDTDYAEAKKLHGAKDAPFAALDELRLVRGVTPAAYRAIAPALTVFGNHARVNAAAAPPAVLAVLPRDSLELSEAPGAGLDERFLQRTGEDIYIVTATARVGAVTARIAATVRYARGEQRSVQVLAWSDAQAATAAVRPEVVARAP
jgi:general secretion pathway protein K